MLFGYPYYALSVFPLVTLLVTGLKPNTNARNVQDLVKPSALIQTIQPLSILTSNLFFENLPSASVAYVKSLISEKNLQIKLVYNRTSKLGDYRPPQLKTYHRISVNTDLNSHLQLMIFIHEFAHLIVWEKHHKKVAPHGKEWKITFKELMLPLLNDQVFPIDLLPLLAKYFLNPKASVMAAPILFHALKNHSLPNQTAVLLKDLPDESWFSLSNNKIYQRLGMKKSKVLCKQKMNGRLYLVHPYCEVIPT